jgi:hypothetical protein
MINTLKFKDEQLQIHRRVVFIHGLSITKKNV